MAGETPPAHAPDPARRPLVIGLTGGIGAGKSTVVKLMARFYEPTSGYIFIDGRPLTELDLSASSGRGGGASSAKQWSEMEVPDQREGGER